MLTQLSDIILDNKERSKRSKKGFTNSKTTLDFLSLIRSWHQIVGDKLTKQTTPLRIRNKTLIILTPHSIFSDQLSFMEKMIVEKIHSLYPEFRAHIKSIYFQINPQFFQEQKEIQKKYIKPKNTNSVPHRFSPEYKKLNSEAEVIFSKVEDPEAKELLKSIYFQQCSSSKT